MTHLLVVDDEVSILELIKNSLGKDGYLITVCQNADDVDIKKLHFYDLILLDVMMPGTDGFEFCKQIRNMVDCPILFLTAKTLEEDILFVVIISILKVKYLLLQNIKQYMIVFVVIYITLQQFYKNCKSKKERFFHVAIVVNP